MPDESLTLGQDLVVKIKLGWLASCIAALVAGAIFILALRYDITALSERVARQQLLLNDQTKRSEAIKEQLYDIQYDLKYLKERK